MKKSNITGKITAIYVRRSVSDKYKGNNSLSIDSQKADCIKYVGDDNYRIYCDDGKSGKDVEHRPAFQQMMQDAKEGLIDRIVVKKYDRFSRNMREYLNITNELDNLGISVFSLTEPFNTATKEGRMMRNNLLNFAEFERETIASRITDAYNTRARETGFHQNGVVFGYTAERRKVNGKTGSVLVPNVLSEAVIKAYELYKENDVSLQDVLVYFRENDVAMTAEFDGHPNHFKDFTRCRISFILQNPLYVRADKEVYKYFAAKGYEMVDDVEAYDGIHGLLLHKNNGGTPFIKVGYHEGLIDAETWLVVQDKKEHNKRIPRNGKSKNSWLTGLIKCPYCNYTMAMEVIPFKQRKYRYYIDSGAYSAKGCLKKHPKTKPDTVEQKVFEAMKQRLSELIIIKQENEKPDTKSEAIKADIIAVDDEIRKLLDMLKDADKALFDYINQRVTQLHDKKSGLEKSLLARARKQKRIDVQPLEKPLANWDDLSMQDKCDVASTMIDVIYLSDENGIDIRFAI
ncbi:MAG: recombinase family protein [Firmicutes bacterium]|nr:recombinase family protein [Bacillota bacterium]